MQKPRFAVRRIARGFWVVSDEAHAAWLECDGGRRHAMEIARLLELGRRVEEFVQVRSRSRRRRSRGAQR